MYTYIQDLIISMKYFSDVVSLPNETTKVNVMVMEKLGYDLAQLVELCGGRFSNETVGVIGLQILDHIEYLHSHG